ncbi:hypothetical protein H8E88_12750 [candidate division KSB1 bacterium]|nr:hypothetical protein [candidate division KSB1 bacterium]
MSDIKRSSILPGLVLIFVGSIILLYKLFPGFVDFRHTYPVVLLVLGVMMIFSVCCKSKTDKGAVFPGTILFLIGLFYFLRNFNLIEYYYVREVWPIFIIIVGLGFLTLFIAKPSDKGVLIPAGILLFIGVISLLNKLYLIDVELWEIIADYWPVILIVIGVSIILGSFKRRQHLEG